MLKNGYSSFPAAKAGPSNAGLASRRRLWFSRNYLSNDPRTSDLPIIYLSGSSDLEEVQRAYNAGADEFLVTPYDPLVLEKKVVGLLVAAEMRAED